MTNAAIAYTNLFDTATILIASSQSLLLPVSNLTVPHIARKWRGASIPLSGQVVDSFLTDYGASVTLDTVAVLGITCFGSTTVQVLLSNIDPTGFGGEIYNSSIVVDPNYGSAVFLLPNSVSARYMRVVVSNAGAYVEAGRVFAGLRTAFAYNFIAGWQRTWTDLSTRSKTRGGQTQIFPNATFRTYDITFDFLKQADRDGFVEDIDRVNAMKTDVLFVGNPGSANLSRDSVWGLMTALSPVIQNYPGIYSKQYTIEERL